MKILVIDDTQVNLDSAKQTLCEHELTLVSTQEQADSLLLGEYKDGQYMRVRPQYDAVLCDLFMPASGDKQVDASKEKYVGKHMPVGYGLLLKAVLHCGVKYAAVVTHTNHHEHPAAAQFDDLGNANWDVRMEGANFTINQAKVAFVNAGYKGMIEVEGVPCEKCHGSGERVDDYGERFKCARLALGKDWGRILRLLQEQALS